MSTRAIREAVEDLVDSADKNGKSLFTEHKIENLLFLIDEVFFMPDNNRRQLFITEQIAFAGTINRADIMDAFGVSVPQASRDIQFWIACHPGKIVYDLRRKHYRKADK